MLVVQVINATSFGRFIEALHGNADGQFAFANTIIDKGCTARLLLFGEYFFK